MWVIFFLEWHWLFNVVNNANLWHLNVFAIYYNYNNIITILYEEKISLAQIMPFKKKVTYPLYIHHNHASTEKTIQAEWRDRLCVHVYMYRLSRGGVWRSLFQATWQKGWKSMIWCWRGSWSCCGLHIYQFGCCSLIWCLQGGSHAVSHIYSTL